MAFGAWRELEPSAAAREIHQRVAGLPAPLRSAALAWLKPESALTEELSSAPPGAPLAGIPYFLKDLFDVAGVPTHAGSSFLGTARPVTGDCEIVRRLRTAGAALAGKTHLVEFAAGLTGENRNYGDCPHPHRADRLAGGSSSGSAALVAAGVVPLSIGTDTGGSVRVPAAFCGLFGYRGTPGDELVRDAFPLSPTCDTAGWFTAGAADMRETLAALVSPPRGSKSEPRGVFLRANDLLAGSPVDAACARAAAEFSAPADADTRDSLLAAWQGAVDAYATVVMSEAHTIHRAWLTTHRSAYDPAIWQRFSDAGNFEPEKVAAARKVFSDVQENFTRFFLTHDFLVLPGAPLPALTKAQCTSETRRAILTFSAPASLGRRPVLTVPVPLEDGLTAGLQIVVRDPASPVLDWVLRKY